MQTNLPQLLFPLIDLTSLNESDQAADIDALCTKAQGPLGQVAAVCVYPRFIKQSVDLLAGTSVRIATVANFPQGDDSLEQVTETIRSAIRDGAQEVDVVFPYKRYLAGDEKAALEFIQACRALLPNQVLKVILETGAFPDEDRIKMAGQAILFAGADFLKTSTGKSGIGATLPAAKALLKAIKIVTPQIKHRPGLKVSGGIRTVEQASQYYTLVSELMGPDWISPQTFRIGASQLVTELNAAAVQSNAR